MSALHRVCLLGFGEVGSILAADLLAHTDVRITVWDRLLSDPASAPAQKLAALGSSGRVTGASGAAGAARGAQVTVCAVTAGQSVAAADSVLASLEPGSWFVDFNSVSPSTKVVVRQAVTGR
jgi:3-hydroxyisobutyrate dehydrogenase-like beta-hydroxyacid dehydrogenase